jgi:hypothetical protein
MPKYIRAASSAPSQKLLPCRQIRSPTLSRRSWLRCSLMFGLFMYSAIGALTYIDRRWHGAEARHRKPCPLIGQTKRPSTRSRRRPKLLQSREVDAGRQEVDHLLYAGNNLRRAQEIFAKAVTHRPAIRLTIRQRTRCCRSGHGTDEKRPLSAISARGLKSRNKLRRASEYTAA